MFRTYAQLVRLPNVFTALADICLGGLVALALPSLPNHSLTGLWTFPGHWPNLLFLLLSSACLYSSGMVWNDFFDIEQDLRERPFRPIPSGRVTRKQAMLLGSILLLAGAVFAGLAGWKGETWSFLPLLVAFPLVVMILLYDAVLKRTWAGPIAMGTCRFLNVLLGVSLLGRIRPWSLHLALVVGIYIAGVTWFARTEARASHRPSLVGAACIILFALSLGLLLPMHREFPPQSGSILFPYLLVGLAFAVGLPLMHAIDFPGPVEVQAAVRRSIFCLVALDAILACGLIGEFGLVILLLLLPTMYLGRWIYST